MNRNLKKPCALGSTRIGSRAIHPNMGLERPLAIAPTGTVSTPARIRWRHLPEATPWLSGEVRGFIIYVEKPRELVERPTARFRGLFKWSPKPIFYRSES